MSDRGLKSQHLKKRSRLAILFFSCLLTLSVLAAGHFVFADATPSDSSTSTAVAATPELSSVFATGLQPLTDTSAFDLPVQAAKISDTGFLQLVNADHPLNTQAPPQLVAAGPTVAVADRTIRLQYTALQALSGLFAAASNAQVGALSLNSGYRDFAAQKLIYDQTSDKSYVQLPGQSEHQTGLAADLVMLSSDQSAGSLTSISTAAEQWLDQHSWRYGFILRYPADKQSITKIAYEPWHFRYIGEPHAWYCWEQGLCLEEYLEYLQNNGGYEVTLGSTTYYVFYEIAENGILYMPSGLDYEVSNDGCGGYIVTAWK